MASNSNKHSKQPGPKFRTATQNQHESTEPAKIPAILKPSTTWQQHSTTSQLLLTKCSPDYYYSAAQSSDVSRACVISINNVAADLSSRRRTSCRIMRTRRLMPMLLCSVSLLLLPSRTSTSYAEQVQDCKPKSSDGKICDYTEGKVCRNHTCISSCATRGLLRCECGREDENYCYLCCGSSSQECRPAHRLNVLRPNGEYWERDTCKRCRTLPDGFGCDDRNEERLCYDGKCTNTICYGKNEGEYCDIQKEKICVDHQCVNPCPGSLVCDCPDLDPDTGMRSDDRCQLCCYNYKYKRCENAYKTHRTQNAKGRPVARVGLTCKMGMKTCNRYGLCGDDGATTLTLSTATLISTLFVALSWLRW